jgi:hypothetical protein
MMFASARAKVAAGVMLLALAIVPAPLLPPPGLAGKVQFVLGIGWKPASLATAILRGREDWARHCCLSAALAVVGNPLFSDAGGLIKEELDALARGSGFSFGDLAADRSGIRFARAATDSESAALEMQTHLADGYSVDDFFPAVSGLPENLTVEQFRRDFGGVGSQRHRQMVGEIEARPDRGAALTAQ